MMAPVTGPMRDRVRGMLVLFALLQPLDPDSAGALNLLDSLRKRIKLSDDTFVSPQQALAKRLTAFRPWHRPPTLTHSPCAHRLCEPIGTL